MEEEKKKVTSTILLLCISSLLYCFPPVKSQQQFLSNAQYNCSSNATSTLGFVCNGAQSSCSTFLTFRSDTPYNSPTLISYLLNATATAVSKLNRVPDISPIPKGDIVLVPTTCSCTAGYYQHTASYTIKTQGETYLLIANDTYQGLTTCQAMIGQNPYYNPTNLTKDTELVAPLRCACPSRNQTANGVKYLVNYLITWGDTVSAISQRFGADFQSVLDANKLSADDVIFPFNTLLLPLKNEPVVDNVSSPPSSQPVASPPPADDDSGGSSKKWVFVGVGVGLLIILSGALAWYFCLSRRKPVRQLPLRKGKMPIKESNEYGTSDMSGRSSSAPFKSNEIRTFLDSLMVYKFGDLERATASFAEDRRIRGSVYRASINGDDAAIKRLKGDVSNEIKILKQINHSNVVRLSGFCVHEGNTYLVYEFVERGSLSDWLHHDKDLNDSALSWKQRVRIAYDIADGLNYLHNYTNPPYIHKNLKSSNILLDKEFRAKLANFGRARAVEEYQGLQLTRHVVGTQGYMAPEYLEHGLITPKLDVFAFGVVVLELLSGKEATYPKGEEEKGELHLSTSIEKVLSGDDVRDKLKDFMDPSLQSDYPFDLALSTAELAMRCVAREVGSRPSMMEVFMALSAIYNSSLDWDPSDVGNPDSMVHGR